MNELKKIKQVNDLVDEIYATAKKNHNYAIVTYKLTMDNKDNAKLVFRTESYVVLPLRHGACGHFLDTEDQSANFLSQVIDLLEGCFIDAGTEPADWKNISLLPIAYEFFSSTEDLESHIDDLHYGYDKIVDEWHNQNPNAPHPFINGQVRTH